MAALIRCLGLFVLVLAPPAFAEETALIDREILFGNPERAQARLSPDGSSVSFLAPLDGVMNVWVAPAGELDKARAITRDNGRGINLHFWAPNSSHVLYVQDTGGDENFHVFSVDVESGKAQDLTPFENTRATVEATSWRHPNEVLIGLNNRDPQLHDIWRINVVTGERKLLEQNDGYAGYYADQNLDLRLALRPLAGGGMQVFKRHEGEWQPFYKLAQEDVLTTDLVAFDASGEAVYAVSSEGRDKAALVKIAMADAERTVLGASQQADVSEVLVDPKSGQPLAWAAEYLQKEWTPLLEDVEADLQVLQRTLSGTVEVVSQTRDNRRWIVASDSATEPLTYHLYDRGSRSVQKLFTARPALAGQPLQDMHTQVMKARDGLPLTTYLTLPPGSDPDGDGRPASPVPLVLTVHGGPWARDSFGYNAWHQWLANRGYGVLSVNYRGSSGFGKAFIDKATGEFSGAMHDDLIDAVDWAVEQKIAAADRVAIMGGSYGGYATLVGVTFTPERFACGVDIVGPSNLVTLIESFPAYWGPMLEATWYSRVGDPRTEAGRQRLEAQSPLFKVDQIKAPLLIGQGANDPRVTQQESEQIVAAMREKEAAVTYVLYPDEGHGFARPENRESFYAITEAFLAGNCLDGRHQPIGDALAGSSARVPVGSHHVPGLDAALEDHQPVVAR